MSLNDLRAQYNDLISKPSAEGKSAQLDKKLTEVLEQQPIETNFVLNPQVDVGLNDRIYLGVLEDAVYERIVGNISRQLRGRLSTLGTICTIDFVQPTDLRWLEMLYVGLSVSQYEAFDFPPVA